MEEDSVDQVALSAIRSSSVMFSRAIIQGRAFSADKVISLLENKAEEFSWLCQESIYKQVMLVRVCEGIIQGVLASWNQLQEPEKVADHVLRIMSDAIFEMRKNSEWANQVGDGDAEFYRSVVSKRKKGI